MLVRAGFISKEVFKKRAYKQIIKMVKKVTKISEPKAQRGIAKSGKFWKEPKEKFRKIQHSLPKKTLEDRLKYREEIKKIKELSKSIKDDKKQVRFLVNLLVEFIK